MRSPLRTASLALTLAAACSTAPPPAAPEEAGSESFDPAREVEQQPFESFNGLRGPGSSINGLRLRGERGSVQLMVSAYDEGRDIVFLFLPGEQTPRDWLAACPPSSDDAGEPQVEVRLDGAGDLSHDVLHQPDAGWSTSLEIARYARLATLRFEICGAVYALEDGYRERLEQHVRLATERAAAAYRGEREEQQRRCGQGQGQACLSLAEMQLHGQGGRQDVGGALQLFREQCERGAATGCLGASTATLAFARDAEDKVTPYRDAMALAVRGCEVGGKGAGPSCWRAATLQAAGFLLPADPDSAERSADASCQHGLRTACAQRSELSSCARGQREACARLADAEAARRMRRDNGEEVLWRMAACRRGHEPSCPR